MEQIRFRGRERRINVPQQIGTNFMKFGILLLEDENGARIQSIIHECRGRSVLRSESLPPTPKYIAWTMLPQSSLCPCNRNL